VGPRIASTKACVFSNINIVQDLSRFVKKDQGLGDGGMAEKDSYSG
jgi:hypothetical protein